MPDPLVLVGVSNGTKGPRLYIPPLAALSSFFLLEGWEVCASIFSLSMHKRCLVKCVSE
jgi:hypothetical protein